MSFLPDQPTTYAVASSRGTAMLSSGSFSLPSASDSDEKATSSMTSHHIPIHLLKRLSSNLQNPVLPQRRKSASFTTAAALVERRCWRSSRRRPPVCFRRPPWSRVRAPGNLGHSIGVREEAQGQVNDGRSFFCVCDVFFLWSIFVMSL